MYKIMTVKSRREGQEPFYQFMTTTVDGETFPLDLPDKKSMDEKVERMLNDEGYAKSDFIIVKVVDYEIDAKNYVNMG